MTTPYKVHVDDVAFEGDLTADDGWVDMRVQFLISGDRGGAKHWYVESGRGLVLSEGREVRVGPGDIAYHEINEWHGFRNDSDDEVVVLWGWGGATSKDEAGYEADPQRGRG